jgi:hypothetical protein
MNPMVPQIVCVFYKVTPRIALYWCWLKWLLLTGRLRDDGEVLVR